jgi:hypothetical protein
MPADIPATDTSSSRKALNAVVRRSEAFGGVVQADDLRRALRALLKRPGAPTKRVLALRSGVAERTISRILHGHDRTTRFDIADALLVALDSADAVDDLAAEHVVD